jgi:hypothetical protein
MTRACVPALDSAMTPTAGNPVGRDVAGEPRETGKISPPGAGAFLGPQVGGSRRAADCAAAAMDRPQVVDSNCESSAMRGRERPLQPSFRRSMERCDGTKPAGDGTNRRAPGAKKPANGTKSVLRGTRLEHAGQGQLPGLRMRREPVPSPPRPPAHAAGAKALLVAGDCAAAPRRCEPDRTGAAGAELAVPAGLAGNTSSLRASTRDPRTALPPRRAACDARAP